MHHHKEYTKKEEAYRNRLNSAYLAELSISAVCPPFLTTQTNDSKIFIAKGSRANSRVIVIPYILQVLLHT
jgi:hypothetical protein